MRCYPYDQDCHLEKILMDESEQIYEFSQDKLQNKNCNSSTTSNRHVEFINGQPIDNMQKS